MKRLLCLFAVLILTLSACPPSLAEASNTSATFFVDTWLTSATLTPDAIYAKGYDGQVMRQGYTETEPTTICRLLPEGENWRDWEWEKVAADPNASSLLVYGDDTLWAVYNDQIGVVDASGINWIVSMSEAPDGWFTYWSFVQDDVLYGLTSYSDKENRELEQNYSVFTVQLSTGETRRIKTSGAYGMTAYQEHSLLLLRLREDGSSYLSQLDITTGELNDVTLSLPDGSVTGLCWDSDTDTLAVLTEKNVWTSRAGAVFEQSADLLPLEGGLSNDLIRATLTTDGRYAFQVSDMQAVPLGTHSDAEKIVMSAVSNFGSNDAQRAFLTKHPEVDLTVQDEVDILSPADVAERVRSGDTTDVFGVWLASGFSELIAKGYVAPLDVGQDVSAMLPSVRSMLTNAAGQPCAGLLHLNASFRKINRALWDEVMGDAQAPTTWLEFLTLQKDFIEEHDDDGLLLTLYFSCEDTFWEIMQAWTERALAAGQEPNFADPLLHETLDALWQVKQAMDAHDLTVLDEAELHPEMDIGGVYSLLWGEAAESVVWYSNEALADVLLPFTFDGSEMPVIAARGQVLVVNPLSAHPDLAAEFIADNVADWQDARAQALLCPAQAVPVESEHWRTRNAELTKKQDALTAQLATADGDAITALQEKLAQVQADILQNDEYRWEVSVEGLAWWQAHSEYVRLFDDALICDADSATGISLMQLGNKWLSGQLELDEMLKQFGKKAEMILAEGR